jgi:predicted hydrolase (HD superfamily)
MGGIYDHLSQKGLVDLGGTRDEWMMAGLLHDADYLVGVVPENQMGIQVTLWLREKGYDIPENVAHAMAAHNWHATNVEPITLMDWAIFCVDTLTGLITACALVMPEKKLAMVNLERIVKKYKNSAFAAGTRRDEIAMCESKLGISLNDFFAIVLKMMQNNHEELGL